MKRTVLAGARFVNLTEANPFHHMWICEGDVSPDRSTGPPRFSILSSENHTVHAVDTISLSLNASVGNSSTASSRLLDEIYCETDWQPNNNSFINTAGTPASMIITPIASVAVISTGLLLYLKKHNH